jgi:GMP synthase (glutamine-hydrolysing)
VSPTIAVIEHETGCTVDRFGPWLVEAGCTLDVRRPYTGTPLGGIDAADGLVVLGGEMGAHDDDVAPWLPQVRAVLREAVERSLPTLGICLGAQLLAVACGGRVEVGAAGTEAGVIGVTWRDEAGHDPLVAGLPSPFPSATMHNDAVVELPPGAAWLGSAEIYAHQVFRVGACAWGVQTHPEVSLSSFTAWSQLHDGVTGGEEAVAELRARDEEVVLAGRALAARFAAVVAAARDQRASLSA